MATASTALAGTKATHVFQSSFGSFEQAHSLAVDESSGDVYVFNAFHGKLGESLAAIEKFDASGAPLAFSAPELPPGTTALDGSNTTGGAFNFGDGVIAVDNSGGPSQGNIYVGGKLGTGGGTGREVLTAFASTGAFLWEVVVTEYPTGLSVDSQGNIWSRSLRGDPDHPAGILDEYSSAGTYKSTVTPDDPSCSACGVAIDSSGNFYLIKPQGINRYSPSGHLEATIGSATFGDLALDRKSNQVFAVLGANGEEIRRVSAFDLLGNELDDFGSGEFTSTEGIAVNSATGVVYVANKVPGEGATVKIFAPANVPVPDVTLGSPSAVTQTSATLKGTVNPAGSSSSYHFDYKKKSESSWTSTPTQSAGSGSSAIAVSAPISGLDYGTTYDIRLIGTNTENLKSVSAFGTFNTTPIAPGAITMAPTSRAATSVALNAEVDPNGAATTYYFEYGTDTSYGASAPAGQDADGGSTRGPVLRRQVVAGLAPGTTYHYRVVATNSVGTTEGADLSFTTRTLAETSEQRGIELVNPPDKGNQTIYRQFELEKLGRNSVTEPISADGNQMLWTVESGAPDSNTGAAEPFSSVRGEGSWQTSSMAPPPAQQYLGGNSSYHLLAVSPDFNSSLYAVYTGFAAYVDTPIIRMDADGSQETLTVLPGNAGTNPQVLFASLEATDDLSHVVLLPYWQAGPRHIYDYGTGTPEMLDVMPNGEPSCGVSVNPPGSTDTGATEKTYHYIATTDASRVYFGSTNESCEGKPQVYVRNREGETTTLVSGPPTSGPLEAARFLRASADGKVAIFETATKLSEADGNEGTDLYRYTEGAGSECLTCAVPNGNADLTPGQVLISNDFSYIYFQSSQLLVPGQGKPGVPHIYAWHGGTVDFVADAGLREVSNLSPISTASLSADGRVLLFGSQQHITADAIGPCGAGSCTEIYRYDNGDSSLECVSCRQGGVTNASVGSPSGAAHSEYSMSADGETIGFGTAMPLVAADVNKASDIYAWSHGVVHLVTDGVTEFPDGVGSPTLFGVSPSGKDIFFTVAAPLTGFEHDGVSNLYDARVDGGFAPPTPPAHCTEDSCQGPLQAPPASAASGSSSFGGPGNEVPRHKNRAKKRSHKRKHHSRAHHGKARHGHRQGGQKNG